MKDIAIQRREVRHVTNRLRDLASEVIVLQAPIERSGVRLEKKASRRNQCSTVRSARPNSKSQREYRQ